MNRSWMRALFAVIAALVMAAPASAQIPWTLLSPWTMNRGGYFLQTMFSYKATDDVYDVIGEKVEANGDYREFAANLHLEYGIRDKLGFAATVPIRALKFEDYVDRDDFNQSTGFSDLTTSLKYRVYTGPVTASVQGEVQMPTGYNTAFTGFPLGSGTFAYGGRALVGFTQEDFPGFVQGAIGYRARSKNMANDVLMNIDAGWWVVEQVLLAGHWERNDHTGDGDFQDLMQAGLDAHYRMSRKVDLLGGLFVPLGGQNEFTGIRFFAGIAYKGNRLPKNAGFLPSTEVDVPPPPPARALTPPVPPPATPVPADSIEAQEAAPDTSSAPQQPETPETPKR